MKRANTVNRHTLWLYETHKVAAAFLITLLLAGAGHAAKKPNIIYILADDLGVGDVGVYGQKLLKTPRIDQLAKEGMLFTQHYSGSSMCAPTRSCLLTGQHTGHTRVRKNGDGPLLEQDVTIGEILKKADYQTAVIGKWGLGEDGSTGTPNKQGFDFWFGYLNQSKAHHHYPPFLWRNEEKELYPDNPTKRDHYSHDLFTDEALGFIKQNQDQPFFLYLAYTLVHVDLDVPEDSIKPWIGKIEETKPYGTPGGQHYIHQEKPHTTFAAMVSRLDRDVGRIVDYVDQLGLAEDTMIIFTSDNGPTSAGGADPKFFDGNGDLRGIKFEFYEGGIRCPMIVRWPGKVKAGSKTDHISAQWDVLPTLAEIAEVEAPKEIDGISFLPTVLGNDSEQKQHAHLYWENPSGPGWQAIRKGKWKAHRRSTRKPDQTTIELYDLSIDEAETKNASDTFPEVTKMFKKLFSDARTAPQGKTDELFAPYVPKKKRKK